MECILHVGIHKTGTTAIQQSLKFYDDGKVHYARLGNPNHSIPLLTLYSTDNFRPYWIRLGLTIAQQERQFKMFKHAMKVCLSKNRERLILSGEELSNLDCPSLERLKADLQAYCDKITIIMFIRHPVALTASLAQELVKHGAGGLSPPISARIRQKHENLCAVFGRDNVNVHKYEEKEDHDGDIVRCFSNIVGVNARKLRRLGAQKNTSISEEAFKIVYSFNQLGLVKNKGYILDSAKWDFVLGLDGIIKKRSRLNSDAFVSHVDLDDLSFVNNHLEAGYEMPAKAGEDFTEWLSRIDSGALLDIEDFLNRKGFVYDYSGEPDVAFSCLFYYFLARRYAKSKWNRILRGADPTKGLKRLFKLAW